MVRYEQRLGQLQGVINLLVDVSGRNNGRVTLLFEDGRRATGTFNPPDILVRARSDGSHRRGKFCFGDELKDVPEWINLLLVERVEAPAS